MKIDWDAMQPPGAAYNWLCSFLHTLMVEMGQEIPRDAPRFVPVVQYHGYTAERYTSDDEVASQTLTQALRTPRDQRTEHQHMLVMTRLANYYAWIAENDVELYRSWYGLAMKELPEHHQFVPQQTTGWELAGARRY